MKKILLMGNPNVGKSVVFFRLTGVNVISANYPGTTVEFSKGYTKFRDEKAEIVDVPGTYSLEPTSKAEETAVEMLKDGDIVINVVDATNLERNLTLTLQLLKKGVPIIIGLNFWDETKHKGISIDAEELERILGVPVIPICAVTGEGIKELMERLPEAKAKTYEYIEEERWHEIGNIVSKVQKVTHRHHTFLERLADFSIKPFTGLPLALGILYLSLKIITFIGEELINHFFKPLFERIWLPQMTKLSQALPSEGLLHNILIGKLIEGKIDLSQSLGILTTGIFVPLGMVFPYVFAFYLLLSILEDSGFLPRVGILTDRMMHQVGLHGLSTIPFFLGLGCNVPGVLASRIMETHRERFITTTLMAISVPCIAQVAMIAGLLGKYGLRGFVPVFGSLFFVWLIIGILLNRFLPGESPEIFVEVPPYRVPYLPGLIKKLWMRIKWFLKEAIPFVLLGIFIINILDSFKIINVLKYFLQPIITPLFGLPPEATSALLVGILRKDVAVGMLLPLNLELKQLVIASVILSMYFPCAATFSVLLKELGIKALCRAAFIMLLATVIVGGVLNLIL
jgi:ferrous iron transport protein B